MSDKVVLVTGVNGFLGSHIVKQLLDAGCKVKGTLKSLDPEIIKSVQSLSPLAEELLELHEVTLESDAGWEKAALGCTSLIHVASPIPACYLNTDLKDDELVVPARDGTLRALKAAVRAGIKQVVLTSGASTMHGVSRQKKDLYTENDWADETDTNMDAYYKSKLVAEKAAWDFLKKLPENDKFDLTVINPGTLYGPILLKSQMNACSVISVSDLFNGNTPNIPNICIVACDVRDVAKAHIKALTEPRAVGRRIAITGGSLWFWDMVQLLKKEYEVKGYKLNCKQASGWALRFYSNLVKAYKKTIVPKIDIFLKIDDTLMKEILNIEPTSAEEAIKSTAESLIKFGAINKP